MRRSGCFAMAAAMFAALTAPGAAAQPACCSVVALEVDPANPARDLVTARDARSGAAYRFAVEGAARDSVRLRQPVAIDAAAQLALVAGLRLRLIGNAAPVAAIPPNTPACRRLSVNGSGMAPGSTLSVLVNGTRVRSFDVAAGGELGEFMQPGLNRVGLAFAAPGGTGPFGASGELRCLPPGVQSSRREILRLQPTSRRLSAEVQVNYVPD